MNVESNWRLILALAVGVALFGTGIAVAAPIASLPVTLTNQQTANTITNLQVSVSFNALTYNTYEATDLGNIRFYNSNAPSNPANALYSWCERECTNSPPSYISFTSNLVSSTGSSLSMTTVGGNPNYWMCGDAESLSGINENPNFNIQAQDNSDGVTEVGNNTANTCTTFDNGQYVGAMIGVNAIDGISPSALSFYYGDTGDSKLLSFTTTTNSFAVIMVMCGQGGGCTAASGGSISGIPSQCNSQSTNSITTPDDGASASLYVCNTLPAGPYTITPNTGGADYTEGAWVFNESAPKSVFWVKLTNSIGNVLTTGNALTLNMIFLPTSTEYDGNVAGEAPQYTVPYANYDNGNSIFNYYLNANSIPTSLSTAFEWGTAGADSTFAENSLADLVQTYVGGENALMVNSLQQPHVGGGGGDEYVYLVPSNNLPQSFIATIWGYTSASVSSGGTSFDIGLAGNTLQNYPGYWSLSGEDGLNKMSLFWDTKGNTIGTRQLILKTGSGAFQGYGTWTTTGLEYNATSHLFSTFYYPSFGLEVNDIVVSITNTLTTTFNSYVVFGGYVYPANIPNNKYFGIVTVRTLPPNGIQPSMTFGGLLVGSTTTTSTTTSTTTTSTSSILASTTISSKSPFTGGLPPSSVSTSLATTTAVPTISTTYPTTSIMGGTPTNSMPHPTTSTIAATTYQTTIAAPATTTTAQQEASGNPIINFFRSLILWLESLFGGKAQ